MTDEENDRINSNQEVFDYLTKHLNAAMENLALDGIYFSVIDILDVITRLAVNDSNKKMIVKSGVLPCYVKLMQPDWIDPLKPGEENAVKSEVAHGLWLLAFNCKDEILSFPGCIEGIKE